MHYGFDDNVFCCVDLKNWQAAMEGGPVRLGAGSGCCLINRAGGDTESGEVVVISPMLTSLMSWAGSKRLKGNVESSGDCGREVVCAQCRGNGVLRIGTQNNSAENHP